MRVEVYSDRIDIFAEICEYGWKITIGACISEFYESRKYRILKRVVFTDIFTNVRLAIASVFGVMSMENIFYVDEWEDNLTLGTFHFNHHVGNTSDLFDNLDKSFKSFPESYGLYIQH